MRKIISYLLMGMALLLVACGSTDQEMDHGSMDMDHGDMEMAMGDDAMMDAMGEGFQVMDVYGRAAPAVAETGAFYMTISNGTDVDEALVSASVELCGTIELHEMAIVDDVMRMQEVAGGEIVIPAGKAVTLKPGGLHVMCLGKDGELTAGDIVPVTLNFQNAGTMTMDAEIREIEGLRV